MGLSDSVLSRLLFIAGLLYLLDPLFVCMHIHTCLHLHACAPEARVALSQFILTTTVLPSTRHADIRSRSRGIDKDKTRLALEYDAAAENVRQGSASSTR